jgi:hypothetical protein
VRLQACSHSRSVSRQLSDLHHRYEERERERERERAQVSARERVRVIQTVTGMEMETARRSDSGIERISAACLIIKQKHFSRRER